VLGNFDTFGDPNEFARRPAGNPGVDRQPLRRSVDSFPVPAARTQRLSDCVDQQGVLHVELTGDRRDPLLDIDTPVSQTPVIESLVECGVLRHGSIVHMFDISRQPQHISIDDR
jgi:hypothetical protein